MLQNEFCKNVTEFYEILLKKCAKSHKFQSTFYVKHVCIIPNYHNSNMSHVMRIPDFCICKNKGTDSCSVIEQLISAFVFTTKIVQSHYFLNLSEISSFQPNSVAVQPGLCWTWLETLKIGFLLTNLHYPELLTWF